MGREPSVDKNMFFLVLDEAIKPKKKDKKKKSKKSEKVKRQTSR